MGINAAYKSQTGLTIGSTEISFATGTTTLTAETTAGQFQLWVDTSNMAAGDEIELYVVEKVVSGGTARKIVIAHLVGAQADPIFISPALFMANGWYYSGKKIAGTDRTYDGTIRGVT